MVAPASISKPLRISAGDLASYYKILGYYHDGPKDTVAVWGALADRWGLSELSMEQFAQLIAGQALDGSGRSTQTQNGVRTGMIDVVYEAPKSVVELILRSPPELRERIIEAFRAAVIEAHQMVHEEARVARVSVARPSDVGPRVCVSGPRKGERAKTQGSVTARMPAELMSLEPVVEFAARPTEESDQRGAPDPHLHAHVPVFAMVAVTDDSAPGGVRYLIPDDHGIKAQAAERSDV